MENLFLIMRSLVFGFAVLMWIKYYLFLLISPFHPIMVHLDYIFSSRLYQKKNQRSYKPLVSVIVPAWNEEIGILKTIKSILSNTYKNIELVVINDGSTDKTHQVLIEYFSKIIDASHPDFKRTKYIDQENGGKGKALNAGIKAATGEIILTIDADSALDKNAIKNLVKYYNNPNIMCVVGNVKVSKNNTLVGMIQQLEYYFGFYFKRAYAVLGAEYIFGGACASFRKTVFDTIGNFDTTNKTEDIEMSMRTKYAGFKSAYAENVVCYTEGASDILGLISQRVRWKKGRFDTFWKYKKIFFSTSDKHNTWLTFFILPYSILAEFQLFFEPISIAILITYTIIASEYLSLTIGLLFIFEVYFVACIFGDEKIKWWKLLSFPFTWILFYFLVWIEYLSLLKSIAMTIHGQEIEWQNWNRKGLSDEIKTI
jgi:poly-beta-1,6-N-acetyl-D-glucosamine synthase